MRRLSGILSGAYKDGRLKILSTIDYLHSLDRMSLVKEVDKRAEGIIKCFLQVNISQEERKLGLLWRS